MRFEISKNVTVLAFSEKSISFCADEDFAIFSVF
jgi:hypothetical protein